MHRPLDRLLRNTIVVSLDSCQVRENACLEQASLVGMHVLSHTFCSCIWFRQQKPKVQRRAGTRRRRCMLHFFTEAAKLSSDRLGAQEKPAHPHSCHTRPTNQTQPSALADTAFSSFALDPQPKKQKTIKGFGNQHSGSKDSLHGRVLAALRKLHASKGPARRTQQQHPSHWRPPLSVRPRESQGKPAHKSRLHAGSACGLASR